jgi:hypothetical protein
MPLSLLNHSALALFAQRTRIPTSARSIGFCAIWVCISSSSSTACLNGQPCPHKAGQGKRRAPIRNWISSAQNFVNANMRDISTSLLRPLGPFSWQLVRCCLVNNPENTIQGNLALESPCCLKFSSQPVVMTIHSLNSRGKYIHRRRHHN